MLLLIDEPKLLPTSNITLATPEIALITVPVKGIPPPLIRYNSS